MTAFERELRGKMVSDGLLEDSAKVEERERLEREKRAAEIEKRQPVDAAYDREYGLDKLPISIDSGIIVPGDEKRRDREMHEIVESIDKAMCAYVIGALRKGRTPNKKSIFTKLEVQFPLFKDWGATESGQYAREDSYENAMKWAREKTNRTLSHPNAPHPTQYHPIPPNSTQPEALAEREEREYRLKSIMSKERMPIEQLKGGIHNGVFYYGTVISEGGISRQAVITSDRKIYVCWGKNADGAVRDEIKQEFGLHYRYDFEHEALDSHWSIASERRFLFEEATGKPLEELYERILKNNEYFMHYPDRTTHKVVALDILSTYFMPIFEAKGRIFLEAETGSGKTRQCSLYKNQACNSIMSADITKAGFFRIMESSCWTLIIDDFDSINEEQKTDILQHYKTGYKNTSKSVRTGESIGSKRRLESFRNFGHTVMNNTSGLDAVSKERSIFLPLVKTDRELTKTNIDEKAPQWQELRDECFIGGLTHWETVRNAYSTVESSLKARSFEISRPLLAMASVINPELKAEVEAWLLERFEDAVDIDTETDWNYLSLMEFYGQPDGTTLRLGYIAEKIAEKTMDSAATDYKRRLRGISIFLGKAYRKLPGCFKVVTIHSTPHARLVSAEKFSEYLAAKKWGGIGCERVREGGISLVSEGTKEKILKRLTERLEWQTDELLSGLNPDAETVLRDMKECGDIFEPRPGVVRRLE